MLPTAATVRRMASICVCPMLSSLIPTGAEDRKQVDQVSSGHFRDSLLVEGMGPSYPPADVAGGHSSPPQR